MAGLASDYIIIAKHLFNSLPIVFKLFECESSWTMETCVASASMSICHVDSPRSLWITSRRTHTRLCRVLCQVLSTFFLQYLSTALISDIVRLILRLGVPGTLLDSLDLWTWYPLDHLSMSAREKDSYIEVTSVKEYFMLRIFYTFVNFHFTDELYLGLVMSKKAHANILWVQQRIPVNLFV